MTAKVAIVGTGYAANNIHIPDWKAIRADIVAVCDINKKNAEKTAKNWGIKKVYEDFESLLKNEEKDVIIDLCTPPSIHAPMAIQAMNSGFNVVIEKPMSMSIEDNRKILSAYEKNKDRVKLCVVRNTLFSQSIREIRSKLEGKHKEVLGVDIRMLHDPWEPMIADKNHWTHSIPGGRFGECLIHPVYILCDLLGEYDLNIENIWTAKRGSYDWVKYDELFVSFTANGKFGSIYISFNSPITTWPPHVKVYTKNGVLTSGDINKTSKKKLSPLKLGLAKKLEALPLLSSSKKEFIKELFYPRRERRGQSVLFEEFVRSIRENKPMLYTPEQAFKSEKIFLDVIEKLP